LVKYIASLARLGMLYLMYLKLLQSIINQKMKITGIFTIFLLMALNSNSQNKIYLWPGVVPGEKEAKHEPVLAANQSGNVIRMTDVNNPALLVYEPQKSLNNGAAVIICPGGGYVTLAMNKEGSEVAGWFNKMGYTAFVLQYRVPEKRYGALQDIQRAMRIIKNSASKWKIDPDKLGVIGFSAGADLCAKLSTEYEVKTYPETDELDKISCRPAFAMIIYPGYLDMGPGKSLTPELSKMDKNTPVTFVFQAADDDSGKSSLIYADALRAAKVSVECHLVPKGGHGYGMRPGNPAAETWPKYAEIWLKGTAMPDH
jgi:acetyl esterase/lipase